MEKRSGRPEPNLTMGQKPAFNRGRPNEGYQALATTDLIEYGTDEWYRADKTTISKWGKKYLGPQHDRFWLSEVAAYASGIHRTKEERSQHDGDVPLPVGMEGFMLLFGFVLCQWTISSGMHVKKDDAGSVESERTGPMFLLVPSGSDYAWYRREKRNAQPAPSPQGALEHLAQAIDDKLKLGGQMASKARSMDAAAIFGLKDGVVRAFLRQHFSPARSKDYPQADAQRGDQRWIVFDKDERWRIKEGLRLNREYKTVLWHSQHRRALPPRKKGHIIVSSTPWEDLAPERQLQLLEQREEELHAERETVETLTRACKLCLVVDRWDRTGRKMDPA